MIHSHFNTYNISQRIENHLKRKIIFPSIISIQHNPCYRYPIKLASYPKYIGLAYSGNIIIQQKNKICYYSKKGNLLNSLTLPQNLKIKLMILHEKQLNLILDKNKNRKELSKEHYMLKWNFMMKQIIMISSTDDDDNQIRKDKIYFSSFQNKYSKIIIELAANNQKYYVRKIKINYFISTSKLQKDKVISSKLVNVQNDEMFANCSLDNLQIMVSHQSEHLYYLLRKQQINFSDKFELKLFTRRKNNQISYQTCTCQNNVLELIQIKMQELEYFKLQRNNRWNNIIITLNFKDFQLLYIWVIDRNDYWIFKKYALKYKQQKQQKSLKINLKQNEYLLKFKDSLQNDLKIQILYEKPFDLNKTQESDNKYYQRSCSIANCYKKIRSEAFIRHDEVIISIINKQLEEKIKMTFMLESIFYWNQDLIEKVIELLFDNQRN